MKEAFFIDFRKIVSVLSYLRSLRLRKLLLLLLLLLLSSQQYVRRSQVNHCTQHTGNQSSSGRQVATVGSPSTLRWHLIVSKFRGRESFSLQRGKYLFKNKGASLCTRFVYQQCSFSAQAQMLLREIQISQKFPLPDKNAIQEECNHLAEVLAFNSQYFLISLFQTRPISGQCCL